MICHVSNCDLKPLRPKGPCCGCNKWEGVCVPNETESSHAYGLEIRISVPALATLLLRGLLRWAKRRSCIPRRYFERRAENLRSNELGHGGR